MEEIRFSEKVSKIFLRFPKLKLFHFRYILVVALLLNSYCGIAEQTDSLKATGSFTAAVTLTTNGLSTFPNLTLGKPAAIFDISMGSQQFRFEPQFRFALNGKPWTFILWCRYELYKNENFMLKLGAHPAFSFKTTTAEVNGTEKEFTAVGRYLAMEVTPLFTVKKNFSLGPYYIYS